MTTRVRRYPPSYGWPPGVFSRAAQNLVEPMASVDDLSPRQQEILLLHIRGTPRREIARRLGISSNTVRNHVQSIYSLIGCSNRVQALRWALGQPRIARPLLEWAPEPSRGAGHPLDSPAAPVEAGSQASPADVGRAIHYFKDRVLIGEEEPNVG